MMGRSGSTCSWCEVVQKLQDKNDGDNKIKDTGDIDDESNYYLWWKKSGKNHVSIIGKIIGVDACHFRSYSYFK